MSDKIPDMSTIVKLAIYSMIVGAVLYWLNLSAGDIYGFVANKLSGVWNWMANSGLQYMLLGATIVVPLYFISNWKKKRGS